MCCRVVQRRQPNAPHPAVVRLPQIADVCGYFDAGWQQRDPVAACAGNGVAHNGIATIEEAVTAEARQRHRLVLDEWRLVWWWLLARVFPSWPPFGYGFMYWFE